MQKKIRATLLLAAAAALVLAIASGTGDAAEKTLTAAGTVSRLDAAERTVVVAVSGGPETRFVWTADTKINGTLAPGAKVTVRYTTLPDGQNLAHQISVARS
ncbi:MAG TPA: DUF5666 domain-containing protein [Thermoanaerobaculia bacterium]|nr:DUF5666 domain-containing protein [Thermoanaerobaculia bacterium]